MNDSERRELVAGLAVSPNEIGRQMKLWAMISSKWRLRRVMDCGIRRAARD